jgi:hypothetical protein
MGENHYLSFPEILFNKSLPFSCGFPPLVPSGQAPCWVLSFLHGFPLCLLSLFERRSEAGAIDIFPIVFEFTYDHC